jgi:hypothetical protein
MTDNKEKIINLITEAKKNNTPVKKERRISLRYLFLILTLFTVIVVVMILAYIRLQDDHRGFLQSFNQKAVDILQRAEELEGEKKYVAAKEMYLSVRGIEGSHDKVIERAEIRLAEKIHHIKEVMAYSGNIQIRNIAIRKDTYELKVSGNIVNKGKRPFHKIELTIYCLDKRQRHICEENLSAVSSDGKPLSRNQKRPFIFIRSYDPKEYSQAIAAIPALVDKVQVIVTDIAFAD